MRIATFNLESLDLVSDGGVGIEQRAEILRPQLERLDADVLCLQEVNGQRETHSTPRHLLALDHLLRGTRYEAFNRAVSAGHGGAPADKHNLVILSRLPITGHRDLRHDTVPAVEWKRLTAQPPTATAEPVAFERPILLAEIKLPDGRKLVVANVHLRAPLASSIPGQKESAFVWRSIGGWEPRRKPETAN